jgi:hypothetical protein
MILRMDDPGGAQNIYNRDWYYPKLVEAQWNEIIEDIKKRSARLSVGYISGWMDDGDEKRGELTVNGRKPKRIAGRIYPSALVRYSDVSGHKPGTEHNYVSEFRGIQNMRSENLGDVELHGYTHIHPDRQSWLDASDRYDASQWYRELGKAAAPVISAFSENEHPLNRALELFREYFQTRPTTLISPGDQWTDEVLVYALNLGLQLVSSYYLAIKDNERFCWATHICSPYLDTPDVSWFNAGLPVVGYFHDRELSLEGIAWMTKWLDSWQASGAKRFMDFRELAAALSCRLQLEENNGSLRLSVINRENLQIVKPLIINIYVPKNNLPSEIKAIFREREFNLSVESREDNSGSITLTVS